MSFRLYWNTFDRALFGRSLSSVLYVGLMLFVIFFVCWSYVSYVRAPSSGFSTSEYGGAGMCLKRCPGGCCYQHIFQFWWCCQGCSTVLVVFNCTGGVVKDVQLYWWCCQGRSTVLVVLSRTLNCTGGVVKDVQLYWWCCEERSTVLVVLSVKDVQLYWWCCQGCSTVLVVLSRTFNCTGLLSRTFNCTSGVKDVQLYWWCW
jgi:hypothetical protein